MSLTPSDVSLLLPGIASLVGGKGKNMQAHASKAHASMEAGSTGQLLILAARALYEACTPPTKLRAMCGAAALHWGPTFNCLHSRSTFVYVEKEGFVCG